jgi:hypothetical protein
MAAAHHHRLRRCTPADLPRVAERILTGQQLLVDSAKRNAVQDVPWASEGAHEIPKRTRREIARDLAPYTEHAHKAGRALGRRSGRTASSRQRSGDIRAWMREHGLAVSGRGRIPGQRG